ncbi:MAG: LuxR C-terminal-related transcriptional regulator, partial [Sedimenticolaceae bacterium]
QLEKQTTPKAIAQLHMRASEWFEAKGLIDEALSHALAAEDFGRAGQIVERNRQQALDADRWYNLEKWLVRLPEALVQQRVGLLMAQVWTLFLRFRFEGVPAILDRAEALLGDSDNTDHEALHGEISLMRGYLIFFSGEGASSLQHIEQALKWVPATFCEARAQSEIIYTLSIQMVGRKEQALLGLDELLASYQSTNDLRKTRLLVTYVFVYLISVDLPAAEFANQRLKMVVDRNHYVYAEAWYDYLQGAIHLCRGEFDTAVEFLRRSVAKRFVHHQRAALDSFAGLLVAYQMLGRLDDVEAMLQLLRDYVASIADPQFWVLVDSVEVRLAILQDRAVPTLRWLKASAPPEEKAMLWWLEIPCISWCRALISEGSSANLDEAQQRLHEYLESSEARHNDFHLIGILTLQAVAYNKQHKLEDALAVLTRALTLAGQCDLMFPFLEVGEPMIGLLERLADNTNVTDFVNRLIGEFQAIKLQHQIAPAARSEPGKGRITESLTRREREILALLAQRLQNKEIAAKLFVSPETVKSHMKSLYQKLDVNNRRDAAARAIDILASFEASRNLPGADADL